MITTVLTPAVRLWLKSQLEAVEDLTLEIQAGDRQVLSGQIAQVDLSAQKAIYQGLHLSQITLSGAEIRTNLGQMLRGQPFRLLESFPLQGQICLQAADVNASLRSPLLAQAITQFLLDFLKTDEDSAEVAASSEAIDLHNPQAQLGEGTLTLSATLRSASGTETAIALRSGLTLDGPHKICLNAPEWLPHPQAKKGMRIKEFEGYSFDLGPDTHLSELQIQPHQIVCQGQVMVQP